MNYKKVLQKIKDGEMTSKEALNILYQEKKSKTTKMGKRATFIKMNINVPDEGKGVNTFLKILFALPIPMIFARMGIRFAGRFVDDKDIDLNDIGKMLKYSKNTKVQVESKDAQINIRIV